MRKIKTSKLKEMLGDFTGNAEKLAPFFEAHFSADRPFQVQLRLDLQSVAKPEADEDHELLSAANFMLRNHQQLRFRKKMGSSYWDAVVVTAGDVWSNAPVIADAMSGQLSQNYAVLPFATGSMTLEELTRSSRELIDLLQSEGASALLLSIGGDELFNAQMLRASIEVFAKDFGPHDYLRPQTHHAIASVLSSVERLVRDIGGTLPDTAVLWHGYDHFIPRKGSHLGTILAELAIKDAELQAKIIAAYVDQFNCGLRRLAATLPNLQYVDFRGVLSPDQWSEELLPDSAGFAVLSKRIVREIRQLAAPSSASRVVHSGPFATQIMLNPEENSVVQADVSQQMGQQARKTSQSLGKSLSLHVGVNRFDRDLYPSGLSNLSGCENDADLMAELAMDQGYEVLGVLKSEEATRDAMIEHVTHASDKLEAGDMFLFSIASHGTRIADENKDETLDGHVLRDELVLMHDYMVLDDEFFHLWAQFKPGVRVVFVVDTCHSGTMVRKSVFDFAQIDPPSQALTPRLVEPDVAQEVYNRNFEHYQAVHAALGRIDKTIALNPLKTMLGPSVIQLSACTDNQLANERAGNGLFTRAIVDHARKNQADHTYTSLMEACQRDLVLEGQTPQLIQIGAPDTNFATMRPFANWPDLGATRGPRPQRRPSVPAVARKAPWRSEAPEMPYDLNAPETGESDFYTEGELEDHFTVPRALKPRSASAYHSEFETFFGAIGLKDFSPFEFLYLGRSHNTPGAKGYGLNSLPPKALWPNIVQTALVLQELRDTIETEMGEHPIAITNAYRNQAYNAAVGGKTSSQHLRFNAVDFQVKGLRPNIVFEKLQILRDGNLFKGGIGLYSSFVHCDTRGHNAIW